MGDPATPVANTGRLWILRLGLYELLRPKEVADDWVWIMDHTIQLGPRKCLIIVGVRLSAWEPNRGPLKHEDLTLLNLTPMEHSSGEAVEEQMRAAAAQTGKPRAVVMDGGTDLKRGTELFSRDHPGVAMLRDITHKGATLLKHRLEADPRWARFVAQSNRTKLQVSQTPLAFLNPRSLKKKARYMNLDTLVRWGRDALGYLDNPRPVEGVTIHPPVLEKKLGWLREHRESLCEWAELLALVQATEEHVRQDGYHPLAAVELDRRLAPIAVRPAGQAMRKALLEFVRQQSAYARLRERLIGSSEVIESLIGKYKRLQSTNSQGGMTAMILSIGAIVAKKTIPAISDALTAITTQDVWDWCQTHLGTTVQAQRRIAFASPGNRNTNQIQNGP